MALRLDREFDSLHLEEELVYAEPEDKESDHFHCVGSGLKD